MHSIRAIHWQIVPGSLYFGLSLIREIPDTKSESPGDAYWSLENLIMFAYVLEKLSTWFETAEARRREAWLASSTDIVQLEQRIRSLESSGFSL